MRFRLMPTDRRSPSHDRGVDYDRLVFDRALLLWLHFALGLVAALMYLSTFDHSHLSWWSRVGIYLVLQSAPAWLPYVISGVNSRRHLPARRSGLWLFVLILFAGTAAMGYFYLTLMIHDIPVFGAIVIQTTAYVVAASVFLGREMDE
jgi:drug/metabolite transporter (DMT)-like permease